MIKVNKYLQSFQKHLLILNLADKKVEEKNTVSIITFGWYYYVEKVLTYLLFEENRVIFCYDSLEFEIDENFEARCIKTEEDFIFELYKKNNLILNFFYKSEYVLDDMFGFIEEEDFNWGLFLSNVINSIERRELIFQNRYEK